MAPGPARDKASLLLDLPAYQYRISKWEALRNKLQKECYELGGKELEKLTPLYEGVYKRDFQP